MTLSPHSGENDPFSAALRAAIAQRGLSLDRIRYHLIQRGHELSVATISYWQSGRSRPERASSIAAIAALEDILGLENGHLAAKLPARRRGSGPSMQSSAPVMKVLSSEARNNAAPASSSGRPRRPRGTCVAI